MKIYLCNIRVSLIFFRKYKVYNIIIKQTKKRFVEYGVVCRLTLYYNLDCDKYSSE
jgi:hypothetical protein